MIFFLFSMSHLIFCLLFKVLIGGGLKNKDMSLSKVPNFGEGGLEITIFSETLDKFHHNPRNGGTRLTFDKLSDFINFIY